MKSKNTMKVTKRGGKLEELSFDKILKRIKNLCKDEPVLKNVDCSIITQKTIQRIYDRIPTEEIDELSAQIAISHITEDLEYGALASRIVVSNNQKNNAKTFTEGIKNLKQHNDNLIADDIYSFVLKNEDKMNSIIDPLRDYNFDYFGFKTLERSYLAKINNKISETPQYLILRVSTGIHYNKKLETDFLFEKIKETYDMMSSGLFTHATPTLFNSGSKRPQLASCFLLSTHDSATGIYKTISDCAIISKWSGGIGVNIQDIRAKGSAIKGTNGKSDGIVPMLKVYNATARYMNQGSKRNGSFAMYIEPFHADIFDFIDLKKNTGAEEIRARDLFYALWIPNLFMDCVEKDEDWYLMCPNECQGLTEAYGQKFNDLYQKYISEGKYHRKVKARDIWNKILESQIETGTPYLLYKDSCNEKSNQKNLGTIKSSNLCVAPETKVLTSTGYHPIKSLENKEVKVWNGEEFSSTVVHKTGSNQKIIKIEFDNGEELECTEYHKFYIESGIRPADNSKPLEVRAMDLKKNMKIIKTEFPVIDSKDDMKSAYTQGFFSGDGTYENILNEPYKCSYKCVEGKSFCKRHLMYDHIENKTGYCCAQIGEGYPRISLYDEKKKLEKYFDTRKPSTGSDIVNIYPDVCIEKKFFVPINFNVKSKLNWLEGICDADGSLCDNKGTQSIQITSIHINFLKDIRLMLNTLGCDCKINLARNKGLSSFPDSKEYYAKDCFRLCISTWYLSKLVSLGFSPKRLLLTNFKQGNRNATRYIKIKNIVCENKLSDTYCFNEGKKHRGVFNGIITGQCSEIIQYSSPDEVSTCNLASISLPKFVKNVGEYDFELLKEVAYKIVYNMNRVIDHNYYPVPEARKSNMRHRPVGVGVQGLADTFILMRYPFDSEEARKLNYNIFEAIYYGCLRASCDLAKTEGQYETFKGSPYSEGLFQFDLWGNSEVVKSSKWDWESLRNDIKNYGLRNSLLTAVMPTASTSQILGNTEAIEPIQSNIFTRTTLSGEFIVVNKYLVKDLQKIGLWNNEMKDRIIYHQGSVQQIPEIPDNIKKLYKTVWEISQRVLIDMSADRSLFIDQSQSLNLFVEKPSIGKLTSMHFYAYKKGLKTGCYYLRSKAARNAVQFTIDPSIEKREQKTQSQEKSHPQPPQPQEPPQESPVLACSLENPDCEMCSG